MRAYVLITVQVGSEYEVYEYIKNDLSSKSIKDIDIVYGEYDLIVRVEAGSLGELHEIVLKIRSNPAVKHTATLISAQKS